MSKLLVRSLSEADISLIADYWLNATPDFLFNMGVALEKMPSRQQWEESLQTQLMTPIPEKSSFCLIWEVDGRPSGHCNINKIVFGKEAFMHLHLWQSPDRQKGLGEQLVRLSLPFFFELYALQTLYCEPFADNPAPNKTLQKVGFKWIRKHVTTPGWLNYEQPVNLWQLTREQFLDLP